MKKSEIYIEKLEHRPGIYIIFNLQSYRIYIGQAKRLKERALQHVKNLYLYCDNNENLQKEFSGEKNTYYLGCLKELESTKRLKKLEITELLDKWESIFYLAAIGLYGKEKVYNKKCLNNEKDQISEIEKAKDILKSALERETKGTERYSYTSFSKMKDWITTEVVEELALKPISIKELFDNHEIDCLLFGKAGDYIGDGKPQTICDILREKVNELKCIKDKKMKKCLWATSGPTIDEFSKFHSFYKKKYGEKKKLYVLFKLTINSYNRGEEIKKSYFCEMAGMKYYVTAPEAKTIKALLIKEFYIVRENFEFDQLAKMYYRYSKPAYKTNEKKYVLNSDCLSRMTLYPAVSKALILNALNEDVRDELGFSQNPYLLEEFELKNDMKQITKFPKCDKEEHPAYYILAEVEDYVSLLAN
ncbi:MAG: GIY-YIG nuclease family protein [Lachnospiraceae bacterium]